MAKLKTRPTPEAALQEAEEAYTSLQEDYSTEQRVALAKAGKAIPEKNDAGEIVNGGYPIDNTTDLGKAVQAFGRAGNKPEAQAHITKRAKALGATDQLPKDWEGSTKEAAPLRGAALRSTMLARLAEAGRILSTANEDRVRTALAQLQAITDQILKPELETVEPPTDVAFEADSRKRSLALFGLEEGESEAAEDASRGAMISAQLIDLIGDEADEPDQVAMLTRSHDALTEWIKAEMAEIGQPGDDAQDLDDTPGYLGWESAPREPDGVGVLALREADVTTLGESAVRADGTIKVKVINSGWGSSGYYSEALLKEEGAATWPAGTKMYWDHPTTTEDRERPERSLRDLAAEFQADPVWEANGPEGPGLYTDAKVFSDYRAPIDELSPHIGVSIRGAATWHRGTAEGKTGKIIDHLVAGESADFVTVAGRGGKVMQLFESYRGRSGAHPTTNPTTEDDPVKLEEAEAKLKEKDTKIARLSEAILLREAGDIVAQLVEASKVQLPEVTRKRLRETLAQDPPTDDEGELDQDGLKARVKEGIAAEVAYLTEAAGLGRPRGSGTRQDPLQPGGDSEEADEALAAAFGRLGLSESEVKIAAGGRTVRA